METNKQKNSPLVFYILGFIVAVFFELYWIGNFPFDYFMIIGIGLVVLITGYLTFDGVIKAFNEAQEIKREQNEIMIKAQKAIYLATKKNSTEAENMQIQNLKAVNLLMDRMVDTITEKQLEMNDKSKTAAPVDLTGLIAELTESNAKLAKELQNAVTVNQLVKANEDLIRNVQDVLNGKTSDVKMPDMPKEVVEQSPYTVTEMKSTADAGTTLSEADDIVTEYTVTDDIPTQHTETDDIVTEYTVPDDIPAQHADLLIDDSNDININDISIDDSDMSIDSSDDIKEMDDDIASAEAAVADASQTIEAMEAANELDADMEEQAETVTEEIESDNSLEAAASALDNDPNATLTPDEIAKLFASL